MVSTSSTYINTLIFCIVAKFLAVAILLLLFLNTEEFSYTTIVFVIETGLIAIIMFTLWKVSSMQAQLDALKALDSDKPAQIDSCPDYFVKTATTDDIACQSSYDTPNGRYHYTFTQSSSGPAVGPIDVTALGVSSSTCDGGYLPQTMSQICTNAANLQSFSQVSWSDLKAQCGNLDSVSM